MWKNWQGTNTNPEQKKKKSLLFNSVYDSLGNIKLFRGCLNYIILGKQNIFCMIFSSILCNFVMVKTVEKLAGQVEIQAPSEKNIALYMVLWRNEVFVWNCLSVRKTYTAYKISHAKKHNFVLVKKMALQVQIFELWIWLFGE